MANRDFKRIKFLEKRFYAQHTLDPLIPQVLEKFTSGLNSPEGKFKKRQDVEFMKNFHSLELRPCRARRSNSPDLSIRSLNISQRGNCKTPAMRKIDDFGGFSPGLASAACQSVRRRREHTRVSRRAAAVARDAKRAIFRALEFCNCLQSQNIPRKPKINSF